MSYFFRIVLCVCFFYSFSVKAFDLDELANRARQGDIEATTKLGKYFFEIEKDSEKALNWIKPAADAGNAEALYYYALILDMTDVDGERLNPVVDLLKKSSEQGFAPAQVKLGKIYQFGRVGIPQDLKQARLLYELAAAKGSNEAMKQLNWIYKQAGNEKHNALHADENLKWLELGAKQGDAEACLKLAKKLEFGQGVPKDLDKAFTLYQQAADKGYIEATASLGKFYANGMGVEQDLDKGISLLNDAAENGFVEAQRKLASIYTYEYPDPVQSYAWHVISLSALFPTVDDLVSVSPDFERLMRSMQPHQIKDGQTLAVKLVEKIKENKKKDNSK